MRIDCPRPGPVRFSKGNRTPEAAVVLPILQNIVPLYGKSGELSFISIEFQPQHGKTEVDFR